MSQITRIIRDDDVIEFSIHDDGELDLFDRYVEKVESWSRASEYTVQTSYSPRDKHHPDEIVASQTFTPNR